MSMARIFSMIAFLCLTVLTNCRELDGEEVVCDTYYLVSTNKSGAISEELYYNADGKLARVESTASWDTYVLSFQYDVGGQLESTAKDDFLYRYYFDNTGRLSSTQSFVSGDIADSTVFIYDAQGLLIRQNVYPGGEPDWIVMYYEFQYDQ